MWKWICAVSLFALSACDEADFSEPEDLRGREIVALDELPHDKNTSEFFGCDGEWSASGGWSVSGTYTMEPGRVCTQASASSICRAFIGAESRNVIRLGGVRYEVSAEREACD